MAAAALMLAVAGCKESVVTEPINDDDVIVVRVVNTSNRTLYIGLNRGDLPGNIWLRGMNSTSQVWVNGFNQDSCVRMIGAGATVVFNFPKYTTNSGCRMFISTVNLTGAPDLVTAPFIFDKVEMGWNAIWNQTSVDFFGIPLQLSLEGGATVGFKSATTRASILQALLAQPAPYNTLVYPTNAQPEIYRMFSPAKASSMTGPPWNYDLHDCLGNAIPLGLAKLAQYRGTFNYGGFNMSQFTPVTPSSMTAMCNGQLVTLTNINTANAFSNEITVVPFNDTGKKVAGIIGCALNRGVLHDPSLWGENGGGNSGTPQHYYVPSADNGNQYNYYSQALHLNSNNGLCYGQSFDDFFHQDASLAVHGGDRVTVLVLPFE